MAIPLPPATTAIQPPALEETASAELQDPFLGDDDLEQELRRLAEEHQKLMAEMGMEPLPAPELDPDMPILSALSPEDAARFEKLRKEKNDLTQRVAELERQLAEARVSPQFIGNWDERQRDYEALLAEKCETIRELRTELQDFRDRPLTVAPKEAELVALSEQLEQDRRQLQEDEAALEEQTRQMEMTIARQRAEIARQRIEVDRMFAELRLELDQAMREGGLRERLSTLQRRAEEFALRTGKTT